MHWLSRVAQSRSEAVMDYADFIREALSRPPVVIEYSVSQDLAKAFPHRALIQGETGLFDIESFAHAGLCQVTRKVAPYPHVASYWRPPEPELSPLPYPAAEQALAGGHDESDNDAQQRDTLDRVKNAWLEVIWEEARLD